jgi:Kef-type K+ transport system membrane component KefB
LIKNAEALERFAKVDTLIVDKTGTLTVPLVLGTGLGFAFLPESALRVPQALFIGTALAVTAVPATVKILIDLKKLETPSGQIIVSAALFDYILSLVLLAWFTGMIGVGGALDLADFGWLGLKILAFLPSPR